MSATLKDNGIVEIQPKFGGPPVVFDTSTWRGAWELFKWCGRYYMVWRHNPLVPTYDERVERVDGEE